MLLAPLEFAPGALVVFLDSCFRFGVILIIAHKLSSGIVMILSYQLFSPSFSPINWCLSRHCSVLGFVSILCFFIFFILFGVVFGALVCFVSVCVLDDRDSIQDYVSVLHQFTLRPLYRDGLRMTSSCVQCYVLFWSFYRRPFLRLKVREESKTSRPLIAARASRL